MKLRVSNGLFLATLLALIALPALSRADDAPAPHHPGIDVVHYDFALTLTDASNQITGRAAVSVRFLSDTLTTFHLDLIGRDAQKAKQGMQVTAVTRDGQAVPYTHKDNRLRIRLATSPEHEERRTYTVRYEGVPADGLIIAANRYGDRTFFADNWPNRARHWLPTVDHPADKATVAFNVTAPDHYQVISNGQLNERTDLADGPTVTRWQSTAPLPTKVMVIGAARFATNHVDTYQGTPVESWVFPQNRTRGFRELARAERILRFFEGHIGDFPYAKLANVQSKTRYGGMENASAIFYNEEALADDQSDEPLLAHEIAHQWFGDAVTETGWAHLWLSEGFATYLADLYLGYTYGRDRLVARMQRERQRVVRFTRKKPNTSLVDTTYVDPNQLLNPFSYQKGAWVLHMLHYVVGDEAFWDGLGAFYRRYRDGNANTSDVREVMEAASGQDLSRFFHQWTREGGLPHYEGQWRYEADTGQLVVTLNQVRPDTPVFHLPLELGIYADEDASPRIETMRIDERQETFTFDVGERPADVRLDPRTWMLMTANVRQQ